MNDFWFGVLEASIVWAGICFLTNLGTYSHAYNEPKDLLRNCVETMDLATNTKDEDHIYKCVIFEGIWAPDK